MFTRTAFSKTCRFLALFIVIGILSPVVLAKLGFWGNSQAAPKFQEAASNTAKLSWEDAVAKASPAVVSIHSSKEVARDMNPLIKDPFFRYFFGDQRPERSAPPEVRSGIGSGVIVTKDGYILTNNHVVMGADEIEVKLSDGRSAKAKIIGTDPETDLAILKVELKDLPTVEIGNSDALKVGQIVFAIGNPFGVGQSATHGIISGTHRNDLGISTFENFIQTDAAINPGNSGGALIDERGHLIAINNAIYTRSGGFQGIGFAIPINLAKDIMTDLIDQGHVTRGWLGVTVSKLTKDIRKSINYPKGEGAVIAGVIRGGPAHNAGIRPGDVVISINNKPTADATQVLTITSKLKPNTAFPISVIRDGETLDFRIVVGKRPVKDNKDTSKKENRKKE